jgi:hypothetical protein
MALSEAKGRRDLATRWLVVVVVVVAGFEVVDRSQGRPAVV